MGRNYSRISDPQLNDLPLLWDSSNSDWRLCTLQDILTLFQDNSAFTDNVSSKYVYNITDSGDQIFSLPDATTEDKDQWVKRLGSGSGKVLFSTVDSQTVDGVDVSNFSLSGDEEVTFFSNDGQWYTDTDYKVKLNPSRIAMQELTSGTLSTSGWYTIAETEASNYALFCSLSVIDRTVGRMGACEFSALPSADAKTHSNTTLKLKSGAGSSSASWTGDVTGFRLAKSDSEVNTGFKLQVHLTPPSARVYNIQIINHGETAGAFLVTPYLDENPTLPDGVTAATFLEAGEELRIGGQGSSFSYPSVQAYKTTSDDQLRLGFNWPEIPKQATSLTLTGSTDFRFRSLGSGLSSTLGSFTISNVVILGKEISCILNQTGISSALTDSNPAISTIGGEVIVTLT